MMKENSNDSSHAICRTRSAASHSQDQGYAERDHAAYEDVGKVSDPKAQALFETSAEVLHGLITAYDHFEQKSEAAWR
jgi:hypothetical protein